MKKVFVLLGLATLVSCGKSGGGGGPVSPQESPVSFTLSATNQSVSLSGSFPVTVTLTSAMPEQGIRITTALVDQSTNLALPQGSPLESKATANQVSLTGLPEQHWCLATVTVTSVATATNSSSQSFTVVYK